MMGLAALPLGAEAAIVQAYELSNWEGTGLTVANGLISSNGAQAKYTIPQLLPGKYKLKCKVTTKVYNVNVEIAGAKRTVNSDASGAAQDVEIEFTLNGTKDVELTFTSTDPGVSGSEYAFTTPILSLDFEFDTIKKTLAYNAQNLATTITSYNYPLNAKFESLGIEYAARQEDIDAANALKTKADGITESYKVYGDYKLYAAKSTIQEEIDALADKAAKAEAAYQNEQAYNRVNDAIVAIKAKYNAAVAELEEALVGPAAAYLLDAALNDLNENINLKLTGATSANRASYEAGKAVADEATNTARIPTEAEINSIVANWKNQATDNTNAYNALQAQVTNLQSQLDNIKPVDAIASLFPKTDIQNAIYAIGEKVANAQNSAAQLTLNIDSDVNKVQAKITELAGKVNTANAEYNANQATQAAIATLQTNLNNAKNTVNAKVSADGKYKAQAFYNKYVSDVQAEIDALTTAANNAYKPNGTGSAQSYNATLNTAPIQAEIDAYLKNAVDAVAKYDALQTAITEYQTKLDGAYAEFENLAIYTAEGYDYKTKLDLIQKRINDIKKAIEAAMGKVGTKHWTAMLGIDDDAAITADIQTLLDEKQGQQNQYDKDYLINGITSLNTRITTFNTNATKDNLGADYQVFADAEAVINGKVGAVETERQAIDPNAADAAAKILALTDRVTVIEGEQTALEAAASAVAAKVAANANAQTTLTANIRDLRTKIGTFRTTYKIGQDDSTLGNRGKADGSVTKELNEIDAKLTTLEGENVIDPTTVTVVEKKVLTSDGLERGIYDVKIEIKAEAAGTVTVNSIQQDYASGTNTYQLNNVIVSDGELNIVKGDKVTVEVKELKYHENSQFDAYNSTSDKTPGLTTRYNTLRDQENALEAAAPGIKAAVENNKAIFASANTAVANLQTAELNTLKNLENVTDANAENTDAVAKKADPADWKVFYSGLDANKTYTAKKAAIDADITALQDAINASNAKETMATEWINNSIIVNPGTDNAKTYSIGGITAAINTLKGEAETENANYKAYKDLQDNNMPKLLPDTITVDAADLGAGAVAYYQGLKDKYIADKANILTRMQADLNARRAENTKNSFVNEIAALIAKVKVVKSDGIANKKKYDEQVKAYTETQILWNDTYTEIAGTDHSTQVQDWLDQLDAIQVDLTAATEAVEANYPAGESVAKAQDFAFIKGRINDVYAQQSTGYNDAVTADNIAAHESFNKAIAAATAAYQRAVQDRARYSSTNADIEAVVDAAAATLDEALYNCPTQIATLTNEENKAYAGTVSPNVFDVDPFNSQADAIEKNITSELDKFKAKVKEAIEGYWNDQTVGYAAKVDAAKKAIEDYKTEAQLNAFKDVEDLIKQGNAGVSSMTLSEVEAAVAGLENIDDMLTADKNKAAETDITLRITDADKLYNNVKTYINGVSNDIEVKAEQLQNLETSYYNNVTNGAKTKAKTFDNRNQIKNLLDSFMNTAQNCKSVVERAVANDTDNTIAYGEMKKALAPVEAKLADAKAAIAPYKYATSFATDETTLTDIKDWVEWSKDYGYAVSYMSFILSEVATLDASINTTLTNAFSTEKTGLAADISELKNQYNTYVAAHLGDDNGMATANGFKTDIDGLEAQLAAIAIVDLDKPADGIQYDEILAATEALVKLQTAIADLETELLQANASTANADVLASFNSQLDDLAALASLEGNATWVGEQKVNGKTIAESIAEITAQIAELRSAIQDEDNISFFKKQYQQEIDVIESNLAPVAAAIAALQKQFDDNATAYATLTAELDRLQALVDAAKEKVSAYKYASHSYDPTIEYAQQCIDWASDDVEDSNKDVEAQYCDIDWYVNQVESEVQYYLDESAYDELLD